MATGDNDDLWEQTMSLDVDVIDDLTRKELIEHLTNIEVKVDSKDSDERLKTKLRRSILGNSTPKNSNTTDPAMIKLISMMQQQQL